MNWATDSIHSNEDESSAKVADKQRIDTHEKSRSRKRPRPNSKSEAEKKPSRPPKKPPLEFETDMLILGRRQKQIDYGKNTTGYFNYTNKVPLDERTKCHPKTPDKYSKYSRRSWDALIKMWRKQLHEYDDSADKASNPDQYDSDDDDDGTSSKNSG